MSLVRPKLSAYLGLLVCVLFSAVIAPNALAQTSIFTVKHPANATLTEFATEGGSRVQHFAATTVRGRCTKNIPIIMVPGLGLSAYMYTHTPDGREGFAALMAAKGFDVYVLDAPYTEPSGIDASRTALSRWSLGRVYTKWGFGATEGVPYPNSQYPTDYLNVLEANFPAYFSPQSAGQYASVAIANNLEELLKITGPAVLMVHSAAGEAAFTLLERQPALDALVVLEPVGCPGEAITDFPTLTQAPMLAVYGDYVAERGQTSRYNACKTSVQTLVAAGRLAAFMDLPAMGIKGNSHLFTQAYNNSQIADLIAAQLLAWWP